MECHGRLTSNDPRRWLPTQAELRDAGGLAGPFSPRRVRWVLCGCKGDEPLRRTPTATALHTGPHSILTPALWAGDQCPLQGMSTWHSEEWHVTATRSTAGTWAHGSGPRGHIILLITGPCNTCDFRECRAFLCNIQTCLFQYFFRCWLGLKVTWRN